MRKSKMHGSYGELSRGVFGWAARRGWERHARLELARRRRRGRAARLARRRQR